MQFIPLRNIQIRELENEFYWVLCKICYVLYSGSFNTYCVNVARSILYFSEESGFVTFKQIKLIKDLKSNKY